MCLLGTIDHNCRGTQRWARNVGRASAGSPTISPFLSTRRSFLCSLVITFCQLLPLCHLQIYHTSGNFVVSEIFNFGVINSIDCLPCGLYFLAPYKILLHSSVTKNNSTLTSNRCMALPFMFRLLLYLKFIFVCRKRRASTPSFSHMINQFSRD